MFFLITGASGVGKSTVRRIVEVEFADILKASELSDVVGTPEWTVAWRQQAVEKVIQKAVEFQKENQHYLLCGDPVAPGELCAAPSAVKLKGVAVCLLDASGEAQRTRLLERGDQESIIPHHLAFAEWMRNHVVDPKYKPEIITEGAWEQMQWDRWLLRNNDKWPWESYIIDTTKHTPLEVAELVSKWIRKKLGMQEETEGE